MDLAIDAYGTYPQRTETDLIGYLSGRDGIIRIEPLDADLTARLLREEESITNVSGGLRIDNRGMRDCAAMGHRFVMFCDASFPRPEGVTMEMVDDSGTVVGHDVPPGMMREFRDRNDVIWMADGFVMYPKRVGTSNVTLVMLSSPLEVPEPLRARLFYPSMTSAHMMCQEFGVGGEDIAAVVLGVDGLAGGQFL